MLHSCPTHFMGVGISKAEIWSDLTYLLRLWPADQKCLSVAKI